MPISQTVSSAGSGTGGSGATFDISPQGTVADFASLPTGAANGDAYVADDNGHMYYWNGTNWINMGQWRGDDATNTLDFKTVSITPTAVNTIPDLPEIPVEVLSYDVNGQRVNELAGGAISRTDAALTWQSANAGYDVDNTDVIIVTYYVI